MELGGNHSFETGSEHSFEKYNESPQQWGFKVTGHDDSHVHVTSETVGGSTKLPKATFQHAVDDLKGLPPKTAENAPHPAIASLALGEGQHVGKGNDAVVWKVGDHVVKRATPVPYHPISMQETHHDIGEVNAMAKRQVEFAKHLRDNGVHTTPTEYHEHEGRAYIVQPNLDVDGKLNEEQVGQVGESVKKMHDLGYAYRDEIQAGVDDKGNASIFDFGSIDNKQNKYTKEDDAGAFARFADDNDLYQRIYNEVFDVLSKSGTKPTKDMVWEAEDMANDIMFDRSLPKLVRQNRNEIAAQAMANKGQFETTEEYDKRNMSNAKKQYLDIQEKSGQNLMFSASNNSLTERFAAQWNCSAERYAYEMKNRPSGVKGAGSRPTKQDATMGRVNSRIGAGSETVAAPSFKFPSSVGGSATIDVKPAKPTFQTSVTPGAKRRNFQSRQKTDTSLEMPKINTNFNPRKTSGVKNRKRQDIPFDKDAPFNQRLVNPNETLSDTVGQAKGDIAKGFKSTRDFLEKTIPNDAENLLKKLGVTQGAFDKANEIGAKVGENIEGKLETLRDPETWKKVGNSAKNIASQIALGRPPKPKTRGEEPPVDDEIKDIIFVDDNDNNQETSPETGSEIPEWTGFKTRHHDTPDELFRKRRTTKEATENKELRNQHKQEMLEVKRQQSLNLNRARNSGMFDVLKGFLVRGSVGSRMAISAQNRNIQKAREANLNLLSQIQGKHAQEKSQLAQYQQDRLEMRLEREAADKANLPVDKWAEYSKKELNDWAKYGLYPDGTPIKKEEGQQNAGSTAKPAPRAPQQASPATSQTPQSKPVQSPESPQVSTPKPVVEPEPEKSWIDKKLGYDPQLSPHDGDDQFLLPEQAKELQKKTNEKYEKIMLQPTEMQNPMEEMQRQQAIREVALNSRRLKAHGYDIDSEHSIDGINKQMERKVDVGNARFWHAATQEINKLKREGKAVPADLQAQEQNIRKYFESKGVDIQAKVLQAIRKTRSRAIQSDLKNYHKAMQDSPSYTQERRKPGLGEGGANLTAAQRKATSIVFDLEQKYKEKGMDIAAMHDKAISSTLQARPNAKLSEQSENVFKHSPLHSDQQKKEAEQLNEKMIESANQLFEEAAGDSEMFEDQGNLPEPVTTSRPPAPEPVKLKPRQRQQKPKEAEDSSWQEMFDDAERQGSQQAVAYPNEIGMVAKKMSPTQRIISKAVESRNPGVLREIEDALEPLLKLEDQSPVEDALRALGLNSAVWANRARSQQDEFKGFDQYLDQIERDQTGELAAIQAMPGLTTEEKLWNAIEEADYKQSSKQEKIEELIENVFGWSAIDELKENYRNVNPTKQYSTWRDAITQFSSDKHGKPQSLIDLLDDLERKNPTQYEKAVRTPIQDFILGIKTPENSEVAKLEAGQLNSLASSLINPLQEWVYDWNSENIDVLEESSLKVIAEELIKELNRDSGKNESLESFAPSVNKRGYRAQRDLREFVLNYGSAVPLMRAVRAASQKIKHDGQFDYYRDALIGRNGGILKDRLEKTQDGLNKQFSISKNIERFAFQAADQFTRQELGMPVSKKFVQQFSIREKASISRTITSPFVQRFAAHWNLNSDARKAQNV